LKNDVKFQNIGINDKGVDNYFMSELTKAIVDLDLAETMRIVKERAKKEDALEIFEEARQGMIKVGELFAKKEYFLSDLVMSGEIFKRIVALLGDKIAAGKQGEATTKVVFGTVAGDIHDIGKDIVINFLRANGFDVYDLGVDVPPEKFVAKVRETGAEFVGLSALLTTAFKEMKATVTALKEAGCGEVKTIIGGGTVNESVRQLVGADYYGADPEECLRIINNVLGSET
jgi:methylmalonyl-CoA mutase cobalamin-binding domain/chain